MELRVKDPYTGAILVVNIGLALEHYPLQELGITDNQPNMNSSVGDEALLDPRHCFA